MTARKKKSEQDNPWPGRVVVMFRGGARDGWCYFRPDAEQLARASNAMGREFEYCPMSPSEPEFVPHPEHPSVMCEVWRQDPAVIRRRIDSLRRSA